MLNTLPRQQILSNNRVTSVAMQGRGKHASSTIELCFLRGPCRGIILKTVGATVQLRVQLWSVNQQATEAEVSPLLRLVTRKPIVKTLQRNSHYGQLLPSKD
jgi:hypothetical protein